MSRTIAILRALRINEVIPFCGVALLGGLLAGRRLAEWLGHPGLLLAIGAVFFLVTFAFVFNDLMDAESDHRAGTKPHRPMVAGLLSASAMWILAAASVVAGILLLSIGTPWFVIVAGAISLVLSTAYSWPGISLKTVPVISSLVHLVEGTLAFILGYWSVSQPDLSSVAVGVYFGLVFAAGHLHHEVVDLQGDQAADVKTHAVRFGPRATLWAGFIVWVASGLNFSLLAWFDIVPAALGWIQLGMMAGYLGAFCAWVRGRVDPGPLRRLRLAYRIAYLLGGAAMAAVLWLGRG